MQVAFDFFNQPELPYIILCNPNKEELYSLGLSYDTLITKRFNTLSDFTCTFPESIDGGETELPAYDHIKVKRLLRVENFGYFQITDVEEKMDGAVPVKVVKSKSLKWNYQIRGLVYILELKNYMTLFLQAGRYWET